MSTHPLFLTCPRGVEPLLVEELRALGATELREARGGVSAQGTLETAYRACLWSRLASRVLLPLIQFPLTDADSLYAGAREYHWPDLFASSSRFVIEVAGRTPGIANTHFAGLKLKDAVVDVFRAAGQERPSVDTENPDIRLHLHMDRSQASLSLDLAGESLHRRGYRARGVEAPLKENLAAAILARLGWGELAASGAALMDPMCGSGTLLLEGALQAADIPPGWQRQQWGFNAWLDHVPVLWQRLREEAEQRRQDGLAALAAMPLRFFGSDQDPRAISAARANAERAGLGKLMRLEIGEATAQRPPPGLKGLVVTNPPYGERLAHEAELIKLYSLLGVNLKQHFPGWRFGFFTAREDLAQRLGLRAQSLHSLYNGALPCKLLRFDIHDTESTTVVEPPAPDFVNRLRKNLKHLGKWAKRSGVNNYRLYDADLPEYAVAVDVYTTEDRRQHVHVQEYAAPKTVEPAKAEKRLRGALAGIQEVLELPPAQLHYKLRQSQKGDAQYQRQSQSEREHIVEEHDCRLFVNFEDYLDTGLFLDHRPIRLRLQHEAAGKRFLNLFCYTGAASVHAAQGGAVTTLSIDLSNTYLDWAQRNLLLNDHHSRLLERPPQSGEKLARHTLIRADCLSWLADESRLTRPSQFDLIFLDPPTFSNSKKMEGVLDIQRDHATMIRQAARLLAPGGVLYFSTNRRSFKLDEALTQELDVRDITAQTLDEDFRRPPPAHRCWRISQVQARAEPDHSL